MTSESRTELSWNAFGIISRIILPYAIFLFVVALIFVFMNLFHFRVFELGADRAEKIVRAMGKIWICLPAQYDAITRKGGLVAGENYVVFNLVVFSSYLGLMILAIRFYLKLTMKYTFPNILGAHDIFTFLLFAGGSAIFVLLDYPSERAGLYEFSVDSSGMYYFHQAFFAAAVIFGPMMLLIFLMKLMGTVGKPEE